MVSQNVSKRVQVRPGDQPGYPKDTIESFVGHSSMGLLCPPALNLELKRERTKEEKREKFYIYSDVTHTHGINSTKSQRYSTNLPGATWDLFLKCPGQALRREDPRVATGIAKMCDSKPVSWGAHIFAKTDLAVRLHIWMHLTSLHTVCDTLVFHTLDMQNLCDPLCSRFKITSPPKTERWNNVVCPASREKIIVPKRICVWHLVGTGPWWWTLHKPWGRVPSWGIREKLKLGYDKNCD